MQKQGRHIRATQVVESLLHGPSHLGGFTGHGDLARPLQQGSTRGFVGVRPSVRLRLRLAQLSHQPAGEQRPQEEVVLQHHAFPDPRRPQLLEERTTTLVEGPPGRQWPQVSLHEGHSAHPIRVAAQVIQREGDAPVVTDQHHVVDPERVDEAVHVSDVVAELVLQLWIIRVTHPDQVQSNPPPAALARGHPLEHVPPQPRRRRVAVQQQHRPTTAHDAVAHPRSPRATPSRHGVSLPWSHPDVRLACTSGCHRHPRPHADPPWDAPVGPELPPLSIGQVEVVSGLHR